MFEHIPIHIVIRVNYPLTLKRSPKRPDLILHLFSFFTVSILYYFLLFVFAQQACRRGELEFLDEIVFTGSFGTKLDFFEALCGGLLVI